MTVFPAGHVDQQLFDPSSRRLCLTGRCQIRNAPRFNLDWWPISIISKWICLYSVQHHGCWIERNRRQLTGLETKEIVADGNLGGGRNG